MFQTQIGHFLPLRVVLVKHNESGRPIRILTVELEGLSLHLGFLLLIIEHGVMQKQPEHDLVNDVWACVGGVRCEGFHELGMLHQVNSKLCYHARLACEG